MEKSSENKDMMAQGAKGGVQQQGKQQQSSGFVGGLGDLGKSSGGGNAGDSIHNAPGGLYSSRGGLGDLGKSSGGGNAGDSTHNAPGGLYSSRGGLDLTGGGTKGAGGGDAGSGGTDHIAPIGGTLQAVPEAQSRRSTAPEGWEETDAAKR